jgi:hypothetical protein
LRQSGDGALLFGLALELGIAGDHRRAAEDDGKDDHDDGLETHGRTLDGLKVRERA